MSALAPGDEFAGYRIDAELSRGAAHRRLLAHELSFDRPVELWVLGPDASADDGQRFRSWVRMLAEVEHPALSPVLAADERTDPPYVCLPAAERTLAEAAEGAFLDDAGVARLAGDLAPALDLLHERGLTHGGLRPADVVLVNGTGGRRGILRPPGPESPTGASRGSSPERRDVRSLAQLLSTARGAGDRRPSAVSAALRTAAEDDTVHATAQEFAEALRAAVPTPPDPGQRRWRIALAVGAVALAAVAAVAVLLGRDDGSSPSPPPAVAQPDGEPIRVGDAPVAIAEGGGVVWVANERDRTLVRIDPRTREIVGAPVRLPAAPLAVAPYRRGAWVALDSGVVLFAGADGGITRRLRPARGHRIMAISADAEYLWVAAESLEPGNIGFSPGRVVGIDARSGRVLRVVPLTRAANVVDAGPRDVWAFSFIASSLVRIDPSTGRRSGPWVVAPDVTDAEQSGGRVWFAGRTGLVGWVDARRPVRQSAPVPIGARASAIAVGAEGVWVAVPDGRLVRIDRAGGGLVGSVEVGGSPRDVTVVGGRVWVADTSGDVVRVLEPGPERAAPAAGRPDPDALTVGPVPLGRREVGAFHVPFEVSVRDRGWSVRYVPTPSMVNFVRGNGDPELAVLARPTLITPSRTLQPVSEVDALFSALREHPQLITGQETTDRVGPLTARSLDIALDASVPYPRECGPVPCAGLFFDSDESGQTFFGIPEGQRGRVRALMLGDELIVIYSLGPEDDYAEFSRLADRLIAGLRFRSP